MSEFIEYSRGAITDFLQTVVIVDDEAVLNEAYLSSTQTSASTELPATIGRGATGERTEQTPDENNIHQLNAKMLSDKFAQKGLLCSTLRPTDDEINTYKNVLKKADIVILDWKLKSGEADGETAKDLIKSIIQDIDGNTKKSLRNIVIYSGESNLQEKIESIKSYLEDELGEPKEPDSYSLVYNNLQIKIYAKRATQRVPQDTEILKDETELVESIIDDFTNQVAGLVPNMALQSLAELRKNTHKILGVFSKELDKAYLSHRIMLPHSTDAESFMINVFISEIEAMLLDSSAVVKTIQIDQIMHYIENKFTENDYVRLLLNQYILADQPPLKIQGMKEYFHYTEDENRLKQETARRELLEERLNNNKDIILELIKKMFMENIERTDCKLLKQSDGKSKSKHKKILELSKLVYEDSTVATNIESKFSILTTLKTMYKNPTPYLTLGTIIKNQDNNYFLCIIPRCDAVRKAAGQHGYPFLELKESTDKFSILVEDDGYKKFKIIDKPEKLKIIVMKKEDIDSNAPLYAVEKKFKNDSNEEFIWVAELKRDKAQSILKEFTDKFSRVGFNESEYLRRSNQ